MSFRNEVFLIALAVFLLVLITVSSYYLVRARKTSRATWDGLLGELIAVDRDRISLIAMDLIEEPSLNGAEKIRPELEPSEIWTMIGGLNGLETLEANCEVLIKLASYVQQWHPEALVVAEELRLNAREITWHIGRLKGAAKTGNLESSFPDYAQRAIATYYLMTRHVLALYEKVNLPELAELKAAI